MSTKRQYRTFDKHNEALDFTFSYNDEETAALHAQLNNSSAITENELRRVSLWKSNRVLSVPPATLGKLNALATIPNISLKDPLVKDVIDQLVLAQGIGFPMASSILKFIRPDLFPIIDVRAYRALTGTKPYYGTYSYKKYIAYAEQLTDLARQLNRPLREIDEQLYCYDEKHNGKI
jgi:hypothetical protein